MRLISFYDVHEVEQKLSACYRKSSLKSEVELYKPVFDQVSLALPCTCLFAWGQLTK